MALDMGCRATTSARRNSWGRTVIKATLNNDLYGFTYEYVRNTMQVNMGNKPGTNEPIFADLGMNGRRGRNRLELDAPCWPTSTTTATAT